MNSRSTLRQEETTAEHIRAGLRCLRTFNRRTVVWPATLVVNEYDFRSTVYDISQGGVRLKLDLPLAKGAQVSVKIKDCPALNAVVMWQASGFVGLNYTDDAPEVKSAIGGLLHIDV